MKKKFLYAILAFAFLISCVLILVSCGDEKNLPSTTTPPPDPTREPTLGLEYLLSDDETYYSVIGIGTATDTDIVIPSTHENLPVSKIGGFAFEDCTKITSVLIPGSVEIVGGYAFLGCTNLKDIIMENGVKTIDECAFSDCWSLTNVEMPDSVITIELGAFVFDYALETITIGDGVETIGESAFEDCENLTKVTIGKNVNHIGDDAFKFSRKIVEVYNKSSLPIVAGDSSFGGIAENAFNVYTPESGESKLDFRSDGYVFYQDGETVYLVGYSGSETTLALPENYNGKNYKINNYAFYDFDNIVSVVIPEGVTAIGDRAFAYCERLIKVTIGDNVIEIGNNAFEFCYRLATVTLGNNIEAIADSAFSECYSLVEVYNKSSLPLEKGEASFGNIAYRALNIYIDNSGASKLDFTAEGYVFYQDGETVYLVEYLGSETELVLPEKYKGNDYGIFSYAFYYCRNLKKISIPTGITLIGDFAFWNCHSLTRIDFKGTKSEWKAISKGIYWNNTNSENYTVYCSDGEITKAEDFSEL